jgi:hypothetical protein
VAKQKFISEVKHIDLKEAKKIVFSQNEQYLFVGTNRSVLKFEVKTGNLVKRFLIPEVYGNKIIHLRYFRTSFIAECELRWFRRRHTMQEIRIKGCITNEAH